MTVRPAGIERIAQSGATSTTRSTPQCTRRHTKSNSWPAIGWKGCVIRTLRQVVPTRPAIDDGLQGESRGRGAGGPALDPGAAAQPALLLTGRAEPGGRRAGRPTERPADARVGNDA